MKVVRNNILHLKLESSIFAASSAVKQSIGTSNMNECCGWDKKCPTRSILQNRFFFIKAIYYLILQLCWFSQLLLKLQNNWAI